MGKGMSKNAGRRLLLPIVAALAWGAGAVEFEAGRHYDALPVPVDTRRPDAIEVVEVFSYACVHCYSFDPSIEAWRRRQPADVDFQRVPAAFNPVWQMLARAYYAAEALNVTNAVHLPLFEAIHVHRMDVRDKTLFARIFSRYANVERSAFDNAYDSFAVDTRVRQADARSRAYRVTGVPTLIVAGKYRVETDMAGGQEAMLDVVDHLVGLERAARDAAE